MELETTYVRDYIYGYFKSTPLEGTFKMQARFAQRHLDEKYPGRYQVDTEFDQKSQILTYTVQNLEMNREVISLTRDITYRTPEEQKQFDQMVDDMSF
jgi:hypothetical protein